MITPYNDFKLHASVSIDLAAQALRRTGTWLLSKPFLFR